MSAKLCSTRKSTVFDTYQPGYVRDAAIEQVQQADIDKGQMATTVNTTCLGSQHIERSAANTSIVALTRTNKLTLGETMIPQLALFPTDCAVKPRSVGLSSCELKLEACASYYSSSG